MLPQEEKDRHEELFIESFVIKSKRDRVKILLKSKKGRDKFRKSLAHYADFDNKFILSIPSNLQNNRTICDLLIKKGSPSNCYIISENNLIDNKIMRLEEALTAVVGLGMGTIISCIPAILCYYEGEEMNDRFVLEKLKK
jgi:hypothetical protein